MGRKKSSGKATLSLERGEILMRTPYDQEFIDAFKNEMPRESRRWDKDLKVWKIQAAYDRELVEFLETWFDEVVFVDDSPPDPSPPPSVVVSSGTDVYGTILRSAPNDLIKEVCRKVLAANHPDRGGKQSDFIAVKSAWDVIKKERGL